MTTDAADRGDSRAAEDDRCAKQDLAGEEGFDRIPTDACMRLLREGAARERWTQARAQANGEAVPQPAKPAETTSSSAAARARRAEASE